MAWPAAVITIQIEVVVDHRGGSERVEEEEKKREEEKGEEERERERNLGRGEGKRVVVVGQPGRGRPAALDSPTADGCEPRVRKRARVRES